MKLSQALRVERGQVVAFVGAGGKTTALFALARELSPCVVTTTTRLGAWQAELADQHVMADSSTDSETDKAQFMAMLEAADRSQSVTLVSGPERDNHLVALTEIQQGWLFEHCQKQGLLLLIEADGSRQKPIKAPAAHEPVIPAWVDCVVVVAGLSGLGKTLDAHTVHRPDVFARLSGLTEDSPPHAQTVTISAARLEQVLTHPQGGLKRIPPGARRIALLNQADHAATQSAAGGMAARLLARYDAVIVAGRAGETWQVAGVCEKTAGVILAAGGATRFGQPKQLLDYGGRPFVRAAAETALAAGLNPVIIVSGASGGQVAAAVNDLPVQVAHNPHWQTGQASSIRAGVAALPQNAGAAVFLLADQPQVTVEVIRALVERHAQTLDAVLAPYIFDRRGNPVLFDRVTFQALAQLNGDTGGRGIFSRFSPRYVNWYDKRLLLDVDTPEDYAKLLEHNG